MNTSFNTIAFLVVLTCFPIVLVSSRPNCSYAGHLDDFEHEATKPRSKQKSSSVDEDEDAVSSCIGGCIEGLIEIIVDTTIDAVQEGTKNVDNILGDAHLPFFRLDVGYQNVESDIDALDFRFEFGLHCIGFQFRQTHYEEATPNDDLYIREGHLLFRIAGEVLEADIGLGVLNLDGNSSNTGPSFTLPLILKFNETFGIEFRPLWASIEGNDIGDYDLTFLCGWQYAALRVGYRWMRANSESLDGPYLGISLRY